MRPSYNDLRKDKQKNWSSQLGYLASLKADRVEGMIIEHEAESAFLASISDIGWRRFSSPVLFCGSYVGGGYKQWFTIVYDSTSNYDDCIIVQAALARTGFPVRLLDIRGNDPVYRHTHDGRKQTDPEPLLFSETEGASDNVLDWARVSSVFWGYAVHNPDLIDRFISETLLKDHYVSEGVNSKGKPRVYVSDIDVLMIGPRNEIAAIEVKHKRRDKSGLIGLNKAPTAMARALLRAGMQFIYLILEKPANPPKSTMYLYFDRKSREEAEWIGRAVTESDLRGELKNAPSDTTLEGRGTVKYVSIPASEFSPIGKSYERSEALQNAFFKLLSDEDKK